MKTTNNVKISESKRSLTKTKKYGSKQGKNSKRHRPVHKNQLFDRLLDAGYFTDERKKRSKSICS